MATAIIPLVMTSRPCSKQMSKQLTIFDLSAEMILERATEMLTIAAAWH